MVALATFLVLASAQAVFAQPSEEGEQDEQNSEIPDPAPTPDADEVPESLPTLNSATTSGGSSSSTSSPSNTTNAAKVIPSGTDGDEGGGGSETEEVDTD